MELCFTSCSLILVACLAIYKLLDYLVRKPRLGNLASRYIFVTGCDTGFGREISKRLDKLGCNVFAGCLTEKGEEELRKSCSSRLKTVHLNVVDHSSVEKAYEHVKKALPSGRGLWGILNNAGIFGRANGPIDWLTLADYHEVLAVNLLGLIDVTVTFLPLVKKEHGRIVNTSSILGRCGPLNLVPYGVTKYGVEAFSDSARRHLRPFRVSVHLIEPGFHKTTPTSNDSLGSAVRAAWQQAPQEIKDEYGQEYLEKTCEVNIPSLSRLMASGRISDVLDAYENALLAVFPRARYLVGNDAKYFWLPLQCLPEWLTDWLLLEIYNNTPAACKK